jgi:iron complex transport system permease protein
MSGALDTVRDETRRAPAVWSVRGAVINAVLLAVLAVLVVVSLLSGRVWLSASEVFRGLFSADAQLASLIVTELRLPRTILAIAVGATLGICGAVLQGLTRNPLAEPGLLGVSAGASLGASIAIYFGMAAYTTAAIPSFGLAAMALTFMLGRGGGTLSLVLAGMAVTGFMFALIQLALNVAPSVQAAYEIMTWLMGSLADRSWDHVMLVAPFIVAGCAMMAFTGRSLDALSLGEMQAESLGVDLHRLRFVALLGTAMAVGAATSVTGTVPFIGLVGPHLVRPFVGYQPSRILLPAALAGAVLLLGADIATRLIRFGPEMKLGVFTALLGTPFFFWLVVRLRRTSP